MAVTMTQVAKEAGVSIALVSRLLRNDRTLKVTDETRQRVLETCQRLGGVRSLPWTLQRPCHVVVPLIRKYAELKTHWFASHPTAHAFEQALQKAGGRVSVMYFDEHDRLEKLRQLIEDPDYCAALLLFRGVTDQAVADLLIRHRFPHICLEEKGNRYHVNTLFADEMGAMRQVVDHLRELGHQRIGYVGPYMARYPLFVAAMLEAEWELEPQAICRLQGSSNPMEDQTVWRQIAREKFAACIKAGYCKRYTAVHAHNDQMALGVIDALRAAGLQPGRDLSVVGYDNIEQHGTPQLPPLPPDSLADEPILTTIDNCSRQVGIRAAARLMAQFHRQETDIIHERIPARLIVRSTTSPPGCPASSRQKRVRTFADPVGREALP